MDVSAVLTAVGFSFEDAAMYGAGVAILFMAVRAYATYIAAMAGARLFPRLPRAMQAVVGPPMLYMRNIALGLDITLNALLAGLPRETVSGRAGRYLLTRTGWKYKVARLLCRALEWPDPIPGHCTRAYKAEQKARESI